MADGASKADVNPQQTVNGIFQNFAPPVREQSPLRKAITAAYRRPEEECWRL